MKKLILLLMPLMLIGCGDDDGDTNDTAFDPNEPLIGSWEMISFEFYGTLFDGDITGRPCIEEGYPPIAKFFANGTYSDHFWECVDNSDGSVIMDDLGATEGGIWRQVGEARNYLISDPNEDEPNEEVIYLEFNNDLSQFSIDSGESIEIWQRQ